MRSLKTPQIRGIQAHFSGLNAESVAARLLKQQGLEILAHRLKTPCGEIDLVVSDSQWLIAVEVKQRRTLQESATSLTARQSQRLLAAFDYVLQTRPDWHRPSTRFDLIIVDQQGSARRIQDALRQF
ncbi:YraN family protein [Gluconobacter morbifer]|uniref:UPF0102 protein GMO_11070 n=1 Tax=Gluconobacter morbifer G707 TaxID=1088869 RepID=G6XHW3_9PROT|nr:YraN family protein [Gluconobacter morbifer]EHH68337.1 hypothetical protein GMO_11070 [Gluconobacter morbifer G707]